MDLLTPQSGSTLLGVDGTQRNKEVELRDDSMYLVDFSTLNSVQDLITVFASLGVSFHKSHPHIELVKPFLAVNNPIPMRPQPAQQKEEELILPDINKL